MLSAVNAATSARVPPMKKPKTEDRDDKAPTHVLPSKASLLANAAARPSATVAASLATLTPASAGPADEVRGGLAQIACVRLVNGTLAVVFVNHPSRGCVIRDTVVVRGPALVFPHSRIDIALAASHAGDDVAQWNLRARVSPTPNRLATDRGERRFAVLVLIEKSPQWYALDATKRASIYKAQTRFNQIAGIMLPPATRRLYRCDAGAEFDFAVWMDYVASNERAVLSTLDILATSPEWDYVEREVRVMLEVG